MRRTVTLALTASLMLPGLPARSAERPAAKPLPAPAVTVTRAVEREIVERAAVTGTLVPRHEVLVAPEIEGLRIVDVLVEEGDSVAKGQVLARLSTDLLEVQLAQNAAALARTDAAIAQARSQIAQAEASQIEAAQALERAQALVKGGNVTTAQLEQRTAAARAADARLAAARDGLRMAEAEQRSTQAQRRELELRLGRTDIKAPEAGLISRRMARVGASASATGEPLFRMIANGEIELEGEMTETQVARVREGAPAQVTINQDHVIEGRVRTVLPEVDRATRLGRVRISLPKQATLRIGSFVRGSIELARQTGVAAPLTSMLYGAAGATIQVVVDERVQTRRVRTGLSSEGFVQVVEGLVPGELVVVRAGSFLRNGDAVHPVLAETAQAAQAEGLR